MDSNTNDMSKILINEFIQRFLKKIETNLNVFGLIPIITIVASNVLFEVGSIPETYPETNKQSNQLLLNLLEDISEVPSTVKKEDNKSDIITILIKIRHILESSINNWVENGYTIQDIFIVFQTIKDLIDNIPNQIDFNKLDFNQSLQQLMY
jgi:hypothetical protein|tara:strand:- start:1603 stop:2058 length:456 start_codon:yes stop_codon:yes gene_type:complete